VSKIACLQPITLKFNLELTINVPFIGDADHSYSEPQLLETVRTLSEQRILQAIREVENTMRAKFEEKRRASSPAAA
jgi:hypothetical protein